MFWSDWGVSPKIERCGMNGDPKTRLALITTNILWPNALTVDYTIDKILWADAKVHTIETADLDGSNRRVILSQNVNHPFSITVFQDKMYWTDWVKECIYVANKFTGEDRAVVRDGLFSPMDIHVYHQQRQPLKNSQSKCVQSSCTSEGSWILRTKQLVPILQRLKFFCLVLQIKLLWHHVKGVYNIGFQDETFYSIKIVQFLQPHWSLSVCPSIFLSDIFSSLQTFGALALLSCYHCCIIVIPFSCQKSKWP